MPITPQYSWEETDAGLSVTVGLPGVSRKALDVFATEALLKVNAPPYLLTVDLAHDVEDSQSTATVDERGVTFTLVKKAPGLWGKLGADGSKEEIALRREASIDAAHQRSNAAREAALKKKQKDEKALSDRQLELECTKRQLVEQRKKEEFSAEAEGLKRWQASLDDPAANDSDTESEDADDVPVDEAAVAASMPDHPHYHGKGWRGAEEHGGTPTEAAAAKGSTTPDKTEEKKPLWEADNTSSDEDGDGGADSASSSSGSDDEDEGRASRATTFRPMPPPRRVMEAVEVEFTKLEMGHLPARENRELELKEYKRQQRELAALDDMTDVSERQPVFLKDKGDALYAKGNFQGALNAYSRALAIDPEHLPSLANRSACHLKLGDVAACVADCEAGLEQLAPMLRRLQELAGADGGVGGAELVKLATMRLRLLARKGAAHCQLDELPQALAAYEAAVAASPDDATLAANVEEVRAAMSPADAASLRGRADARVKAGDPLGGAEAYSMLLGLTGLTPAERLAGLSNRSVCYLMAGDFQPALNDCNAALVMLLEGLGVAGLEQLHVWVSERLLSAETGEGGALPEGWALGGAQRASLQRLLARRGAAASHLRRYAHAVPDLSAAAALCTASGDADQAAALEADAVRVRALMEREDAAGAALAAGAGGPTEEELD
eukprot:jgi/Tetstr1/422138/TSEL_012993.t1